MTKDLKILKELKIKPCTLKNGAKCSPSQGPCCNPQCTVKFGEKCRDDNGCRDPSFCDGSMPQCPPSVNKANKTICNKEFVCFMGVSILNRISNISSLSWILF